MNAVHEAVLHFLAPLRQRKNARIMLATGLALLLAALVWSHRYRSEQAAYRAEQEHLLRWMEASAMQVRDWQARHPLGAQPTGSGSLLATVSASAQTLNLPLQRASTEPNGIVSIALGDARFDHLLPWLDELATRYRLRIEWITIIQGSAPGLVDVQVRIGDGSTR